MGILAGRLILIGRITLQLWNTDNLIREKSEGIMQVEPLCALVLQLSYRMIQLFLRCIR